MGRERKKGDRGAATNYISRNRAQKKLQLSLQDFRRLCILKGVYPHEPRNKKKVSGGSTANRTYYYVKDIQYLAHEPVLDKFREFKVFMRRLRRAIGREDEGLASRLAENEPVLVLDHIVKERYPTFVDAVRDLDDCLSMIFLFATLPQEGYIKAKVVQNCRKLSIEFLHYIIAARCLNKVFVSIKGIYYQAEIEGENVTWVVPHQFAQSLPSDVDFRIMATFLEFYVTLLGFVNFRLYSSLNLHYPPKLAGHDPSAEAEETEEILACLVHSVAAQPVTVEDDDDEDMDLALEPEEQVAREAAKKAEVEKKKFQKLFADCRVFLSRETPHQPLVLALRSLGGEVSWCSTQGVGSVFQETDDQITHQVADRPSQQHQYLTRSYIQPQWVFDSINARKLLPVDDYFPGVDLPPHLSPFVEVQAGQYLPPEQVANIEEEGCEVPVMELEPPKKSRKRKAAEQADEADEEEPLSEDEVRVVPGIRQREERRVEAEEEKELAIMAMPKKKRRIYDRIMHSRQKKSTEVRKLKQRRRQLDSARSTGD